MADELHLTYLNRPDVEALALTDDEILGAVEAGLRAQGRGEAVIEPRVHLRPDESFRGHFNVLRGYIAPLGLAGIKVVGDYVDNYRLGLPSRGHWAEVLNSDSEHYGGSNLGNLGGVDALEEAWHGQPFSASLSLPPLAGLILRPDR